MIAEFGFTDANWNTVRILDDFPSITHWQRQAKQAGQTGTLEDMAQTADQDWHIFHLFRESQNDIAGSKSTQMQTRNRNHRCANERFSLFIMSYGNGE